MRTHEAITFIELSGETVPAGRLRIIEDNRHSRAEFEYGRRYLERPEAVPLDPVMLPLQSVRFDSPPDYLLFNAIRDASPDAFGRSLIDSFMLRQRGAPAGEAEFLLASQCGNRIGALRFGPTPKGPGRVLPFEIPPFELEVGDLARFQEFVDHHLEDGSIPQQFLNLVAPGSDLGGARPKATVMIDGFPWLAKFGKDSDRVNNAAIEAGCLDLCEMAGIEVPERRVAAIGGKPVLLLRRFDRDLGADGRIRRRHMISGLTLLGAHESDNGMSGYADLFDGLRRFGSGGAAEIAREIYKRMVMNVLCGNTDDHYRNHAFLLGEDGRYRMSPVYDVMPTLQASPNRRLFLHLGKPGSGREATLEAAIAGAQSLGLRGEEAVSITDELSRMVAARWRGVMMARGASPRDCDMVASAFSQAGQSFGDPDTSETPWSR